MLMNAADDRASPGSCKKKGRAPGPPLDRDRERSGVDDLDDLERPRVHHDDLVVDEEELISTPFRIDRDDFRRQRMESDVPRNVGADRNREVDIGHRAYVLRL